MAAPRTKVEISAVYKALKVNGETGTPAKKFLDLIFLIEQLGDKQQVIRARDLSDEHIGMQLEMPTTGMSGIINDVDTSSIPSGLARRVVSGHEESVDAVEYTPRRPMVVTIVLDSKLKRIHVDHLVVLTELRDI